MLCIFTTQVDCGPPNVWVQTTLTIFLPAPAGHLVRLPALIHISCGLATSSKIQPAGLTSHQMVDFLAVVGKLLL
jgi:hypothetical protein